MSPTENIVGLEPPDPNPGGAGALGAPAAGAEVAKPARNLEAASAVPFYAKRLKTKTSGSTRN